MTAVTVGGAHEGRLKELDGWRAISVLLVVFYHLGLYQHQDLVAPHVHFALVLSHCGPLGVDVFFVISGFIICRLLILEEQRYGSISLKGFYIRRVFRILPPFYFYLATLCLLLLTGLTVDHSKAILNAGLFLYDFSPAERSSWFAGHSWSLAVEEQFYLTFPAILLLAGKTYRKRVFPLLFLLIAFWNLSVAIWHWENLTNPSTRAGFACISLGVVLGLFESRARAVARAVPAILVAASAACLFWHPLDFWTGWRTAVFESFVMPPLIALLLIFSLERGAYLRAFLCWKPIQAIGLTSYGIYLWQQLFTAPSRFYTASGRPIMWLLPLLFVVIPFSYLLIEKPAMRFGKRLSSRVRGQATQKAVA
jgi:peptidoglycan/LPS O-acetylase OafA/YrhL